MYHQTLISSMQSLQMDPIPETTILTQLQTRHQTTINSITEILVSKNLPQTMSSYYIATVSSLNHIITSSDSSLSVLDVNTISNLISFLSDIICRVSVAVVRSKWDMVVGVVRRALELEEIRNVEIGVKKGLKCLVSLVKVGEKNDGDRMKGVFEVVVGFVTDSRVKVRKQSHACLHEILQSIHGSPTIELASKEVTNVFQKFFLQTLDGTEGPKGAQEVIYMLNALKDCFSYLSIKHKTQIMRYCKPLVDLRQPIVTRAIMEILQAFCSNSNVEVESDILLNLLCLITSSNVNKKDFIADQLASIARLLCIGTKKVYVLNRDICVVKLPFIFNMLGDILASEHEEAAFAASEALKSLMSCIDEDLMMQGVDQTKISAEGGTRNSAPTIVEKICSTMDNLLSYHYNSVWNLSFQILSAAFYQLGKSSSNLMAAAVRSLAKLHNYPDESFPLRKQLHECVGSAVRAMGPENLLNILPLNLNTEEVSDDNVWVLPILKKYIIGANLKFFSQNILVIIKGLQQNSHELEIKGQSFSAKRAEGFVYQLWSLLPAFCNYPVDTSTSFKDIQKIICDNLAQEYNLHGIMCSSLQILIQQNKSVLEGDHSMLENEVSDTEKRVKENYIREVAEENLKTIRLFSSKILSVLSDVLLKTSKDDGGCLQTTVRVLASVSDKIVVKNFFKKVMIKLYHVTEQASKIKQAKTSSAMQIDSLSDEASLKHARGLLLDIAASLLPGMDEEETALLFTAIKSSLQDKEGSMQKKAYKTLAIILKESKGFLLSQVDELLVLMLEASDSCHFSAKRNRVDCLYYLIVYVLKDTSDQRKGNSISIFLTEIILALKEANGKTRNRAYDLLVEIGHVCGDEELGGKKENLLTLFHMIVGGLASEEPQMISASVRGLARLTYEFSYLMSAAYSLLPSSFLLLQRKNQEIIKANLGLIKVLVTKSKAEGLQMHLRTIVEGLMKLQDSPKNHFKAKVKLLIELLVGKCGMEAVRAVMPEEYMKLLTNIRKIKERKERETKSQDDSRSSYMKASISRKSKWNHTHIFSDVSDGDEHVAEKTVIGRKTKASSRSIRSIHNLLTALEQTEDDPLDLLVQEKTKSLLLSSMQRKRKTISHSEPELDTNGHIIIREDDNYVMKPINLSEHSSDARSKTKFSTKTQTKRIKTSDLGWAYTGDEYHSKKAKGDLKKKDKFDPYAYWPLDRKLLNRRGERKASARKGMASVVKFAKSFQGKRASNAFSYRKVNLKNKVWK